MDLCYANDIGIAWLNVLTALIVFIVLFLYVLYQLSDKLLGGPLKLLKSKSKSK